MLIKISGREKAMHKDNGMLAFTVVAIVVVLALALFLLNAPEKPKNYEKNGNTAMESANYSQGGVVGAQCAEGARASCVLGECAGEKVCIWGKWSGCVLLPKICVPNSTSACAYDSCRFGEARCNPCGNGYGKCELIECEENERCGKR